MGIRAFLDCRSQLTREKDFWAHRPWVGLLASFCICFPPLILFFSIKESKAHDAWCNQKVCLSKTRSQTLSWNWFVQKLFHSLFPIYLFSTFLATIDNHGFSCFSLFPSLLLSLSPHSNPDFHFHLSPFPNLWQVTFCPHHIYFPFLVMPDHFYQIHCLFLFWGWFQVSLLL